MKARPIFIVEDDRDIRENLQDLLESEGYTVLAYENGKLAFDNLLQLEILPKMIFLDLMMPIMDGRKFIKEVQGVEKFQGIPIMVLTAGVEKVEGKIVGMMKKPLDINELLRAVTKFSLD